MRNQESAEAEAHRLALRVASLLREGNHLGVGRGLLKALIGDVRFCGGDVAWTLLDVLGSLPEAVGNDHKAESAVRTCGVMAEALKGQLVKRKVS